MTVVMERMCSGVRVSDGRESYGWPVLMYPHEPPLHRLSWGVVLEGGSGKRVVMERVVVWPLDVGRWIGGLAFASMYLKTVLEGLTLSPLGAPCASSEG